MKFDTKSLLKDKRVLYTVAGLSLVNMIGYMSNRNYEALIIFFILMLVASRFTKNMILIMGVALFGANLLIASGRGKGRLFEGFKDDKDPATTDDEESDEESEEEKDGDDAIVLPVLPVPDKKDKKKKKKKNDKKSSEAFDSGDHDVDFAATLEQAYGKIDNMLGADGGKKWGDHMDSLFKKQSKLLTNINKMEPLMEKMGGMAEKTQAMSGMLEKFGGAEKKK